MSAHAPFPPFSASCRDETTVLAFNGLGKVLRAHMPTVLALPGINDKWDEVCRIASQALMSGRKSVAVSAAQLLTGFLQVCWHGERAATVSRPAGVDWQQGMGRLGGSC